MLLSCLPNKILSVFLRFIELFFYTPTVWKFSGYQPNHKWSIMIAMLEELYLAVKWRWNQILHGLKNKIYLISNSGCYGLNELDKGTYMFLCPRKLYMYCMGAPLLHWACKPAVLLYECECGAWTVTQVRMYYFLPVVTQMRMCMHVAENLLLHDNYMYQLIENPYCMCPACLQVS